MKGQPKTVFGVHRMRRAVAKWLGRCPDCGVEYVREEKTAAPIAAAWMQAPSPRCREAKRSYTPM
jgi:predicted ATP-dependent serine protease